MIESIILLWCFRNSKLSKIIFTPHIHICFKFLFWLFVLFLYFLRKISITFVIHTFVILFIGSNNLHDFIIHFNFNQFNRCFSTFDISFLIIRIIDWVLLIVYVHEGIIRAHKTFHERWILTHWAFHYLLNCLIFHFSNNNLNI